MPKYSYNVHVVPNPSNSVGANVWLTVVLDHKADPDGAFCLDTSVLGQAALARAKEISPLFADCTCEEWNGGEPVLTKEEKFLGKDYEEHMEEIREAAKPMFALLKKYNLQLAISSSSEFFLTAIPWFDDNLPADLDHEALENATVPIHDKQLVAIVNGMF